MKKKLLLSCLIATYSSVFAGQGYYITINNDSEYEIILSTANPDYNRCWVDDTYFTRMLKDEIKIAPKTVSRKYYAEENLSSWCLKPGQNEMYFRLKIKPKTAHEADFKVTIGGYAKYSGYYNPFWRIDYNGQQGTYYKDIPKDGDQFMININKIESNLCFTFVDRGNPCNVQIMKTKNAPSLSIDGTEY